VLDGFKEPLIVIDDQGTVVDANRAASAGSGLDLISLFGKVGDDPRLSAFLRELRVKDRHALELELPASNVARHFLLEGVVVDGKAVILARDRTEQQNQDEEVRQLRRMQALGLVTASVVHDFNNLMVPILCLSELLTKELDRSSPAASLAADVRFAAERAAALVRDIYTLTRAREASREPVDLSGVIKDLLPLIERMLAGKVELCLGLEARLGNALVDRERLEHAILNLIANARDAMPHGGRLTITTANVAFVADPANSDGSGAPSYVTLVVEDTGVGMTEAVRARVFDSFYTTKEAGGTGLGLASVKRFVGESGGLIALHSEPGRGTLVTMHLPRIGRHERPTIPDLGGAEAKGRGETILVVDDDEPVRRTVKAVLEACGYTVIGASSAEDALRAAESTEASIDLMLIDTTLPRTDYQHFLPQLRASASRAGVLFMSALENPGIQGPHADGDRLLKKAFSIRDLMRETRAALDAAPVTR